MCAKLEVITEPEFANQRLDYLAQISDELDSIRACLRGKDQVSDAPVGDQTNIG